MVKEMAKVENKEEKKSFLAKIMEVGRIMAGKSKDEKVNKAIKKRANY